MLNDYFCTEKKHHTTNLYNFRVHCVSTVHIQNVRQANDVRQGPNKFPGVKIMNK